VGLLALIAVVLGATAVAYNVLDRPAVTAIGVLLSFVLLVQFGAFLGELSERPQTGDAGDTSLRHALTVEPRRLLEMLADFVVTCVVFFLSYVLVLGGLGGPQQRGFFLAALPVLLGARYVSFVAFRIYRRAWRYAIGSDVVSLVAACVASQGVAVAIMVTTRDLGAFPASIFVVDLVMFTLLTVGDRLGQRLLPSPGGSRRRVLVVGADAQGRGVARSLRREGARVIGFVDDDAKLQRRRVQGVPVVGTTAEVAGAIDTLAPDEVVVSGLVRPPSSIESLRRACTDAGIPLRLDEPPAIGAQS
jgi:FlaA1/EpsC-like NDP-sugar epimerase